MPLREVLLSWLPCRGRVRAVPPGCPDKKWKTPSFNTGDERGAPDLGTRRAELHTLTPPPHGTRRAHGLQPAPGAHLPAHHPPPSGPPGGGCEHADARGSAHGTPTPRRAQRCGYPPSHPHYKSHNAPRPNAYTPAHPFAAPGACAQLHMAPRWPTQRPVAPAR